MSGLGGAFFQQKANGEYSTKTMVGKMVDTAKKVNILKKWQATGLFQHYAGCYVATASVQKKYCKVNGCNPANTRAGVSPNPFTAQFLVTYPDAVPMPNIPEMAAIWGNVGDAWGAALREEDASNPKTAFSNAAQNIKDAING